MQSRSFFCYHNSVYLYTTTRRFLFAHICRNSLFIICSLQNSSYCLLSTISGIFTINALLQQSCVPFHFDKQASFATSTPTNFCLQNHNRLFTARTYIHNKPQYTRDVFYVRRKVGLMKMAKVNAYIMHIFGKIEILSIHAT